MVDLARKTIVHEWRRFAPAVFAVAFSGVLLFVQAALAVGMFDTIAVYIRKSSGDLWISRPNTQSIDQGRPLSANIEAFVRMNPHVKRVEPFSWGGGTWRSDRSKGSIFVYLTGVDPSDDGLILTQAMPLELRRRLIQPYTVLVDISERKKLGVEVGEYAEINGTRVQVVGFTRGMRALGGVNVVASLSTAQKIDPAMSATDEVAYFVAQVDDPNRIAQVKAALSPRGFNARYEALSAQEFADRTTNFWLFESGMGVTFLVSAAIAFVVSLAITSQTLMAAVAASIREYATLRALGVSSGSLRAVVMQQSGWVGVFGLGIAAVVSVAIIGAAALAFVPIGLNAPIVLVCAALLMAVALGSGVAALTQLAKADPASLLR